MKYDLVQVGLELFVQSNWSATEVQYSNIGLHTEALNEYMRCHVIFGEGIARTIGTGCYRQFGLLTLTAFVRPSVGTARLLELATDLSDLVRSIIVPASGGTPAVQLKVPSLFTDYTERDGWVQAQVSCPFYYDL